MSEIDKLKKLLSSKRQKEDKQSGCDFLGTGSTLLNLACTGHPRRGFAKGKYFFIVGDSKSGKTFLSQTCLAEAAKNKNFDDYRFIFDDGEDGALMNIEKFFGKAVAERTESPGKSKDGSPSNSYTIEDFYYNLDDALRNDRPCIYILDSQDVLTSEAEDTKFDQTKSASRKGTASTGTMTDGKAKKNSTGLRRALKYLKETGSILIIINQTRDNLGFGSNKKARSGGKALRFYATLEFWSSVKETLKKRVRGKDREVGAVCKLKMEKNRFTGQRHTVDMIIYHSHGIDDVESNVEYLIEEGHWKKKAKIIVAEDFEFTGTKDALIQHIEEKNLERKLQSIVGRVWNDIVEQSAVKRKRRYE